MAEPSPADRINAALARIEAAIAARADGAAALARRHATLRRHMQHAIAALDEVIAKADDR